MNTEAASLPLNRVPREFVRVTGRPGPGYRKVHSLAVDGLIPAAQGANGRWGYLAADLPGIIATLEHVTDRCLGAV